MILKPFLVLPSCAVLILLLISIPAYAQAPEPDGAGVRSGVLPRAWNVSGPDCRGKAGFQVHEYNPDL